MDTPDIILHKGQTYSLYIEYKWGPYQRNKTWRGIWPMNIHLKDVLKMRQKALQTSYKQNQSELGGTPPILDNIVLEI